MEVVCGETFADFSTDWASVNSLAVNGAFYAAEVASAYQRLLFNSQRLFCKPLAYLLLPHLASEVVEEWVVPFSF